MSGPATNDPFEWVSPDDGTTTAPSTKTQTTDSSGIALFQWTPNSVIDPRPWDSTISFSEQLLPNWQIDPSTYAADNNNCSVKRLGENDFTVSIVKTSPVSPGPGDLVTFGLVGAEGADFVVDKADIVSCTVKNIEPPQTRVIKGNAAGNDTVATLAEPGGPVTIDVEVFNDATAAGGAVLTSLVDDIYGDITQVAGAITATTCATGGTVPVPGGGSYTCDFTVNVNSGPDTIVDTVTATLTNGAVSDSDTDQANVVITDVPSSNRGGEDGESDHGAGVGW